MSRYPVRESRTNLSPELVADLLTDEENASGLSDLSQSLSRQSDSNADDSIVYSDSSTPTASRQNSIGHIIIPEEDTEVRVEDLEVAMVLEAPAPIPGAEVIAEVLQVPEVRAMADTVVLATFDDLTGTEVRLAGQRTICYYVGMACTMKVLHTLKEQRMGGTFYL